MPRRRRGVCQSYGEKLLIQITKSPEEFKKITKNYSSDLFKLKERMNQLGRMVKEEIGVKEKEFQEIISLFITKKATIETARCLPQKCSYIHFKENG